MPDTDLESFATDIIDKVIPTANKIAQLLALESTKLSPPGWSGQLKKGIRAEKAVQRGNDVFARVKSFAADASGNNYALNQHDEELRHFNPKGQPALKGFADVGYESLTGRAVKTTKQARYARGYARFKDKSPKYKTEFFLRGFANSEKQIDDLISML